MKELLFLAHRIPYPPTKGDKLRSFHLLKHLGQHYRVRLGCFVDDPGDWQYRDDVRSFCAEAFFVPLQPWSARVRSLSAMACGAPLSVRYYRDARMRRWVESVLADRSVQRALIFSSVMAQYVEGHNELRRVADLVDVDSRKWDEYAGESTWPLSWLYARESRTLLAYERSVAERFDATVFVSRAEAGLFRALAGRQASRKVYHAENGVDSSYFDPESASEDPFDSNRRPLVFTGAMDYKPNVDAAEWFARAVFPRIAERWPDACFAIVGARPDARVRSLAALKGVLVTGSVPDVRPYLAHAAAVVAPLRIARGIQNKVLEGMAMAKIVIASPAAAEGIDAEPGREILLADSVDQYLSTLAMVFDGAFAELGTNARSKILTSYGWAANLDRIGKLLAEAPGSPAKIGGHAAATA